VGRVSIGYSLPVLSAHPDGRGCVERLGAPSQAVFVQADRSAVLSGGLWIAPLGRLVDHRSPRAQGEARRVIDTCCARHRRARSFALSPRARGTAASGDALPERGRWCSES
jgi:hypothetical protein